jgi:hypothetical protein
MILEVPLEVKGNCGPSRPFSRRLQYFYPYRPFTRVGHHPAPAPVFLS